MRKIGIIVGVVVLLIFGLLLALPALINVEKYRGRIQTELQKKLNRPVQFGKMNLKLLPLSIRVENVSIGEDARFGQGAFATAEELRVSASLLPLISGNVEVGSLTLQRPKIELIRDHAGVWNFSSLGAKSQDKPEGSKGEFEIGELRIADGTVALTDRQKNQQRVVYDHIDLALKDFARDKQFSVEAAAHLPGEGTQQINLDAKVGPLVEENLIATPIDGTLKMEQAALSAVQRFANAQALEGTDALVSGEMKIRNADGKLASDGTLKLENAKVRNVEIGYPISLEYSLIDELARDLITLNKANVKLGGTELSLAGMLNAQPTPMLMDMKLNAGDVSLTELARLAAAFGVAFDPGMKVEGRATANVQATGAANNPALNGTATIRDLNISGGDLPTPVKVANLALTLSPQAIQSNDFTASAGATNVGVKFALAQYASPQPSVDATVRTANANIAELLAMAKAYGVEAAKGMNASGTLSLDVRATGPVKNPDAMTFAGTGKIANASLKPADFTQPLVVRNADVRFNANAASLENLAAALGSTNAQGAMTVRNFKAPNVNFNLRADQINVTELQAATGGNAQGGQTQPAAQPNTQAKAGSKEPSMLAKATGGGQISVGKIVNDQLVLNNVNAKVVLDRGVIRMSPVTAGLYNGVQTGSITVNTLTTPMTVNVASKLERVDANALVSSMTSLKNTLYGLLMSNGNVTFSAGDANTLARSLNGNFALNLQNGRIAKIDMLNQLSAIGKFAGFTSQAQSFTPFAKLAGNFDVRNGIASTNNLVAAIEGGTLAGAGSVNLADQTLNMRLTAVLSKGFADRVGGTGIGGFMTTALANRNGELVIPVVVTGSFDAPKFSPDTQKIAEMKLQNLLPTTGNPGQLSSGILGAVLGGKGGNGAQAGGAKGALGGILGAIGGRQQGQQQQQQQGNNAEAQPQQQTDPAGAIGEALGGLFGGKKKQQQQQPAPK